MKRCCAGDDAAHAAFYNQFHPFIKGVVSQQLRRLNVYHNTSDIDDLVNDILLIFAGNSYQAFESIKSVQSIHGWLYVLVKNFVLSYVRKEARMEERKQQYVKEQQATYIIEVEQSFVYNEQKELVLESLNTLDTQERLIVTMYYLDHLKYFEIAAILNMNINTVATKIKRAKEKLHKALRRHKDDL